MEETSLEEEGTAEGGVDTSQDTDVPGKRWNLRVRKSRKQDVEEEEVAEEEQEEMEEEEEEQEDDDDDAEMEEEEEEEEQEDEEEPEEEVTVKKRQQQKVVVKESSKSSSIAAAGRSAGGRKRQAVTAPVIPPAKKKASSAASAGGMKTSQVTGTSTLYGDVTTGKTSLKALASNWVESYSKDPEAAVLELLQFFVMCCGSRTEVTMEMFRGETSEVVRVLADQSVENVAEYPLIASGAAGKKFKALFTSFLTSLVRQCQSSIVYDEYMMDTLIIWLVGFTDSNVRAFRHTSTVACMTLLSALIELANGVNYVLDNTQRQVEAERKRQLIKRTVAGQTQLERLVAKRKTLQENKTELEEMMNGLFSSVFIHRYRDVRPEIRAACITELGNWLLQYSVKFLFDNYLKYVGWMLFDKIGEVRVACLRVLDSLYSSAEHAPHLELFTARFKGRLLSMRLDIDETAAVTAISVLTSMLMLELLDAEESVEVCELIFLESRAISHAAGQFAVNYLFSADFMERSKRKAVPAGKKKPTDSEIKFMELVRFFCEVKVHDHAHYFVDSLWDHCEVLQDWPSITNLLLDAKSPFVLGDEETRTVVEILVCAARRAAGATPPAGRARNKFLSAKEKKTMEEVKTTMCTHFMATLPELLTKYGNDADNATNLVGIPQCFDLELYAEHRLHKSLEEFLTHLHQLTLKHVESTVLDECAQTLSCLLNKEFSLYSTVDVASRRLMDDLVEAFKTHYSTFAQEGFADEEEEEGFSLLVSLRRIASYYKLQDLSSYTIAKHLTTLLQKGVAGECSERIVENVIVCLKLEVMWGVHQLEHAESPTRDAMRAVHIKRRDLFEPCEELVRRGMGRAQREAYVMFTDLLVVFSRALRKNAQLAGLVYVPEANLQETLQAYVMDHVINSNDEDQDVETATDEEALVMAEKLNDSRILLAGFLKLTMFNVVDAKMAAPIWGHFISQYHNFGDLIRISMNKCRETNPIGWSKTAIVSLSELYLQLEEDGGGRVDPSSEGWPELRELAKKFSLSLGIDAMKVRQALVGLHREGIVFAMSRNLPQPVVGQEVRVDFNKPPPHINFLYILSEFSHRLLAIDRSGERGIIPFLMKQLPEGHYKRVKEGRIPGWDALVAYHRNTQVVKGPVPAASQSRRGRKRKSELIGALPSTKVSRVEEDATPVGSDAESEEGEEDDGNEAESATPPQVITPPTAKRRSKRRAAV